MTDFVVDASIAAVWLLSDEKHPIAEAAMDRLIMGNASAPDLLIHEVRSLLLTAERRKRISSYEVQTSLARVRQLRIRLFADGDDILILRLAREHRLSTYDAAYLALASNEGLPLATLDRKLHIAAVEAGISVVTT